MGQSIDNEPMSTVASVITSLTPGTPFPPTSRDLEIAEVAHDLQLSAAGAQIAEAATTFSLGPFGRDRMTEILGRLASVGEQLGIASAASRDARRWFTDDADPRAQIIAVRSLAEAVCYWAIGSAHGLANVLVRMLVLNPQARVIVNSAYKKADGFAPFSESEDAWISFGARVVSVAREAAAGVESEAVNLIVDALGDLAREHRWIAGLGLRAESFHRWRPQSIDGGVAKRSSWSPGIAGQLSMEAGSGPTNVLPDHLALLRVADDALDSVVDAARVFDTNFARATVELGVPIFKLS